jgi:threonine dehydrogenase-like Zn-dependent dehydrogenase
MPFVMGHEIVANVIEIGRDVQGVSIGDRVVVHPALGCRARGVYPPCDACGNHHDALCRNVTRGDVSAGIQTGYCRDTGGGFGEQLVAHESQLYRVPEPLDDRTAVLIEPLACATHAALRVSLTERDTVLVIGSGAIGLLTIAALRASGCRARILAVAKYDHQRRLALELGADELLDARGTTAERYGRWAAGLDAEVLAPELGKPTVIGGASATFDCVASSISIDDGIRFTRSGGSFILVGMPGVPRGVDWTPLWFKELNLHAAYAYGTEHWNQGRKDTFALAIEWAVAWAPKLRPLVGEPFALADFRAAFSSALHSGRGGAAKTVFGIQDQ